MESSLSTGDPTASVITAELSNDSTNCFEFESADSTVFCVDCKASYCPDCSKVVHRPKAFQSHNIVDPSQKSIFVRCPHHTEHSLEHFCTLCNISLCVSCGLTDGHHLHPNSLVNLSKIQNVFLNHNTSLQETLDSSCNTLKRYKEEVQNKVIKTLTDIHSSFVSISNHLINQSENKLVSLSQCRTVNTELDVDESYRVNLITSIDDLVVSLNECKETFSLNFKGMLTEIEKYHFGVLCDTFSKDLLDLTQFILPFSLKTSVLNVFLGQPADLTNIDLEVLLPLELDLTLKQMIVDRFANTVDVVESCFLSWLMFHHPTSLTDIAVELFKTKTTFSSISSFDFSSILNFAIDRLDSKLFFLLLDQFSFDFRPTALTVPISLLTDGTLTNPISEVKADWLERVIIRSRSEGDARELKSGLVQRLLGRKMVIRVWVCSRSSNFKSYEKYFQQALFFNVMGNFDLDCFDVITFDSFIDSGYDADKILESGQGLMVVRKYIGKVHGSFSHSILNNHDCKITTNPYSQQLFISDPTDPIVLNVTSLPVGRSTCGLLDTDAVVVTNFNHMLPTIVRKEVASGRLVELGPARIRLEGCPRDSSVPWNKGLTTEDHYLILANAVLWCSKML
ncbi:hypothetical protein GEMRC1_005845 [Eukaryota sp. GEM-RC1]